MLLAEGSDEFTPLTTTSYRQWEPRERQGSELCFRNASTTSEASGAHTTWTSCATVKPVESTNILKNSIVIHY